MRAGRLASVQRLRFPRFEGDGTLTEFSDGEPGVPFRIRRVFTIAGVSPQAMRGDHAHRGCSQMLTCLRGRVTVTIDDGLETASEVLRDDGTALLIPPMLWNSEVFDGPSTVLAVFCDERYHPGDYIRDRGEYLQLQAAAEE
jgi:dTDP-4-dehydrorhamnose 3,5-epimerase-like enzyme